MILHSVELPYKERLRLRGISDTHIGARSSEEKRLKKDLDRVLEEEDSYIILLGDQVEAIVRQDLKRFAAKAVREDMLDELDSLLNAQLRVAVETFKPLAGKGKILGALMGNHELKIKQNYSFDLHREFCEKLNIKNLGYSCMIRATIWKEQNNETPKKRNVIIHCHHGHGGSGKYTGASINSLEQESGWFQADIFLQGHNHKRHASTRTILGMSTSGVPRLVERDVVSVRTGSYYKTYQQGEAGYGEVRGYPPTKIGNPPHIDIKMCGQHHDLRMTVTQ